MTDLKTEPKTPDPAPAAAPARRPTWTRFIPPLLAAGLVAVLGFALLRGNSDNDPGGPLVGKPAPDFSRQFLSGGGNLKLSSLKGRPVLVNFWASWCPPCVEEAPLLNRVSAQQRADGLAIVGVIFQDEPKKAQGFIDQYGLAFTNVLDPDSATAIDYGVAQVPESFFIDKNGVVQAHVRGGLDDAKLRANLAKIGVN